MCCANWRTSAFFVRFTTYFAASSSAEFAESSMRTKSASLAGMRGPGRSIPGPIGGPPGGVCALAANVAAASPAMATNAASARVLVVCFTCVFLATEFEHLDFSSNEHVETTTVRLVAQTDVRARRNGFARLVVAHGHAGIAHLRVAARVPRIDDQIAHLGGAGRQPFEHQRFRGRARRVD